MTAQSSLQIRADLVEALRLDLVGPDDAHAFAHELLPEPPSRWYLTGFLVPESAPIEQRSDEGTRDEVDGPDAPGRDDSGPNDRPAARKTVLPSSLGLSVLVAPAGATLEAIVSWGDYRWEGGDTEPATDAADPDAKDSGPRGYRREPRRENVALVLPTLGGPPTTTTVVNSGGLDLVATARAVEPSARIPGGATTVSVFLVNRRPPAERPYQAFIFQAGLTLRSPEPFVARPDLRGAEPSESLDDWDEAVADLHYRDCFEYAVGHGVSAAADRDAGGQCYQVRTTWIPTAQVERVAAPPIAEVELGMEVLGGLTDGAEASKRLLPLVSQYREWIAAQEPKLASLEPVQANTARDLLTKATLAANRIEAGIGRLSDPAVLAAFRIANRAMASAARRREAIRLRVDPNTVTAPEWRPFQLAFLLMTLGGIAEPTHDDRETVDLLFFPTGGGKTEAYLGLAAFTMVLRRLRHPGIGSAGVTVLMRYTLRLLTLDQLGRAAALICALELEREKDRARLGEWPFEIGLWVGSAATPNRMGKQGYRGPGADDTAYARTRRFWTDSRRHPAPIPIENCPWCGTKFEAASFRLGPNPNKPDNLDVHCANHRCDFSGNRRLPIIGVDEPVYRRLPAFLIATVDKFAALPWTGETGALFGTVDRYDRHGFYGPCQPGQGQPLGAHLPAPDLVIQDELHLISGPLGTIAGLYETVIDALSSRTVDGKTVAPKIVASTATVRRAGAQIRALFGRADVQVFPAPGPDRGDSFFARTQSAEEAPARLYLGIAAQGRSLKVVLLRAALALLSAGQTAYERAGGRRNPDNPADPYLTLLGYFNSLRELGGSRRIVEDEVKSRLEAYGRRRRREPEDRLFSDRRISYDVLELTSRVPTAEVAGAKRRLALPFSAEERVDVALATNMISVGLDIGRLGLMMVLGQPKTSAEYIQSTSRVGRESKGPGLVVTLLNVHKPRDRSHYERFENYHGSFYRSVEVTSVTPFSPRALDRALVGALVALCRHGLPAMTPALGAGDIGSLRQALEFAVDRFAARLEQLGGSETSKDALVARCRRLLDDWASIQSEFARTNTKLQYQRWEENGPQRLLYELLDPELDSVEPIRRKFRANRSMRDVEASVDLKVQVLDDWSDRR